MTKTDVIYRKFKRTGEIIAIFPSVPGSAKWFADCAAYDLKMKHRTCSVDVFTITTFATSEEQEQLKKELGKLNCEFVQVSKFQPRHLADRKKEVESGAIWLVS